MTTPHDSVRAALTAAAARVGVSTSSAHEVMADIAQRVRRRRRRQIRSRVGVSAMLIVGGVAGIAAISNQRQMSPAVIEVGESPAGTSDSTALVPLSTTTPSAATNTEPVEATASNPQIVPPPFVEPSNWTPIPPSPLAERAASAVVGAGDEIFVWGGAVPGHLDMSEPPYGDGAMLAADHMTWRVIAPSPLPAGIPSAIWVGDSVVVLVDGSVGRYWPSDDRWELIEGREPRLQPLVVAHGMVHFVADGFRWDVSSGQWAPDVEPVPGLADSSTLDWSTLQALSWRDSLVAVTTDTQLTFHRLDQGDSSWTELGTQQSYGISGQPIGVWGDELVVVPWTTMEATALDLTTGTWRDLPTFPTLGGKCSGSAAEIEGVLVVELCGTVAALRRGEDQWQIIGPSPGDWSDPMSALTPTTTALFVNGWVTPTGGGGGWLVPSMPWRLGGVTVEPGLRPAVADVAPGGLGGPFVGPASIDIDLSALGCLLRVAQPTKAGQLTLTSAYVDAGEADTGKVIWWNGRGVYELTCPDSAALKGAVSQLRVAGELGAPIEVTVAVRDLVGVLRGEQMDAAEQLTSTFGASWIGADPSDPGVVTFGVPVDDDDAIVGLEYRVRFVPGDEAGTWLVAEATVANLCSRGVDPAGLCV